MFWRRLTNGNEKLMQQQLTGNSDSNSLGGGTDTGTYEDILQKQYVPRLCVPLEIAQYFVVRFLQYVVHRNSTPVQQTYNFHRDPHLLHDNLLRKRLQYNT